MSKICLITFDVTNTLLHLKNSIGFEYLRIAQIYGVKVKTNKSNANHTENQISKAFRVEWKRINDKYPNFGSNDNMDSQQWWAQLVSNTFRSAQYSQQDIDHRLMKVISSHLFKHYSSDKCWTIDENSHQIISGLKKTHPQLIFGVISNFDERLHQILCEVGLRHYFDFVLISKLVKFVKPDKQIFDLALNEAKLDTSRKALHIGDDLQLDYLSAKSYGWNALLLKNKNQLTDEELLKINTNHIIYNLNELINHKILR